ncbi:MAG TPA: response regulator, partial [Candidatus Deferrimicrobiaceae bacterium]|nr:response regulator [Candidatus Deferrimicrobiaceae bacterium]
MRAKGRVFLIDDDGLILSMLSRALRNEGYEVQTDASGEEVVSRVRSFHPDVVLLDIRLPGKSGMELLEEIVGSGMDTQVVMLTSDDTAETAIRAMKRGAVDYLTKPFNLDEVVLVIGKVIGNER